MDTLSFCVYNFVTVFVSTLAIVHYLPKYRRGPDYGHGFFVILIGLMIGVPYSATISTIFLLANRFIDTSLSPWIAPVAILIEAICMYYSNELGKNH